MLAKSCAESIAFPAKLHTARAIHVLRGIDDVRRHWRSLQRPDIDRNNVLGFVPTMGALHEGHLSLVRKAKLENQTAMVSIFVNPTQFSAGEDFDKYPRTLERDIELLKSAGADSVFCPGLDIMYSPNPLCHVEAARLGRTREGIARPEFFRGVATVVTKLFNIVRPDVAYFGQKVSINFYFNE